MQFDNKRHSIPEIPAPAAQRRGLRVLVVDDNPVNLQMAAAIMEKLGYRVDAAADGQEAIDLHARSNYDLLLMDCEMPRLDGFQATRHIREADGATRRTPVIGLSASAADNDRDACLAAGMDDFLSKPLRPAAVMEVLQRVLRPAKPAEVPVSGNEGDELDAVRTMFGSDFSSLATLYLRDTPPRLAGLRAAQGAGDGARLVTLAHALAGSSMSIGATSLSGLCKELEAHARAQGATELGDRLANIEAEYIRISDKLQAMR